VEPFEHAEIALAQDGIDDRLQTEAVCERSRGVERARRSLE